MDDKTRSLVMMASLLAILILVVGVFQFYVEVKMRVSGLHINYVNE